MARLLIFWGDRLVGHLIRCPKFKVRFQYEDAWLEEIGYPISLSLLCDKKKHSPGVSTAFFENLLPESEAKTILAFNHQFDKKDTFGFLRHFGEDCAGALSVIPEDNEPDSTPGRYKNITLELIEALGKIQRDPGGHKLFSTIKNNRLSIAGAQDKLPVFFSEGKFYLPANSGSATTHIIKPASPVFPEIQRNEAFCMALAQKIGIDVPDSQLFNLEGHELFIVDRYDRIIQPDKVVRLHQEDFCQALGIPSVKKYQEKGGPGFHGCRELIDDYLYVDNTQARKDLVLVTVFNYLTGNHDAHGKNFSIFHGQKIKMTPFYDLLSTQVYPDLEQKFSMSIGQTFRHDRIKAHSFKAFANIMNFRPRVMCDLMDSVIRNVEYQYESLLSEHIKCYGPAKIYDDLHGVLTDNLERLKKIRDDLSGDPMG